MLISHLKKFIFIHNYKVAGTSIRAALIKYADISLYQSTWVGKFYFLARKYPKLYSSYFPNHITAKELREQLPQQVFENYFKFGFVRNPWDWQVSIYNYTRKSIDHHQHDLIKKMSFDEYIDWRVNKELIFQKSFFYDQNGEMLVDFLGKYSRLEQDFKKICDNIKIKATLPHLNISRNDRDYLKYYNKNTLEIINQAYKEDIQLFGYEKPELVNDLS